MKMKSDEINNKSQVNQQLFMDTEKVDYCGYNETQNDDLVDTISSHVLNENISAFQKLAKK